MKGWKVNAASRQTELRINIEDSRLAESDAGRGASIQAIPNKVIAGSSLAGLFENGDAPKCERSRADAGNLSSVTMPEFRLALARRLQRALLPGAMSAPS